MGKLMAMSAARGAAPGSRQACTVPISRGLATAAQRTVRRLSILDFVGSDRLARLYFYGALALALGWLKCINQS
jgi:hypothetical protein